MSVAASFFVQGVDQARRDAAAAVADGARLLELRLDRAPELDFAALVEGMPLPVIAACPLASENGAFAGGPSARLDRLAAAARGGAAFLDLPHAGQGDDDPGFERLPDGPWRAVRSWHEAEGERRDLRPVLDRIETSLRPGDVAKIVAWAATEPDSWRVYPLGQQATAPLIAFAQGPGGRTSRLWAPALGAPWVYASLGGAPTAPGQWTTAEMAAALPEAGAAAGAPLYAVVGNPVDHSRSPLLWRRALRGAGLAGVYGRIEPPPDGFRRFLRAHRHPAFRGFSVTAPFKADALACADEADPGAARVGAANTLQRLDRGWRAWNTDGPAAMDSLAAAGAPGDGPLLVLGAGGAAAAVVCEAVRRGHPVVVSARRPEAAEGLASRFGARAVPLEGLPVSEFPLVVQATPVGSSMREGNLLFDNPLGVGNYLLEMIYQPATTALSRESALRGAVVVGGAEMLLRQMLAQFRILTGADADPVPLRAALAASLVEAGP